MMGFQEFIEKPEIETLEEGVVRTGALLTFSAQSKNHGNKAERYFREALSVLKAPPSKGDPVEQRLARLEKVIAALAAGLIEQRLQIGSSVAVNLTGHLLTNKSINSMSSRRKR